MAGISFVTRFIRSTGTATGLAVTALSVAGLPIAACRLGWGALANLLDHHWPSTRLPEWLEVPWDLGRTSWGGGVIPAPPSWLDLLIPVSQIAALLALGLVIAHTVLPMELRLRRLLGVDLTPSTGVDPCQHWINHLQRRHSGPRAQVWIAGSPGIQAFAISAPFGRHAIVISQDLYARAHPDIRRWVLAHEYAHLLHGDTRSRTLWLLAMRSLSLLDLMRQTSSRLGLRFIAEMPLLRLFSLPAALALRALERLVALGKWAGGRWFLLFDCWASRRMEFAADRFATLTVGVRPGEVLFESLRGDLEPRFNGAFASHPTFRDRIRQIRKVSKKAAG